MDEVNVRMKLLCVRKDSLSLDGSVTEEDQEVEFDEVETNNLQNTERFENHDLHSMTETAIKLLQQSAKRKQEETNEKKRSAFAEYIVKELSKIEDEEIAEDVQFSMILLIRDAIKKDREQKKSS